MRKCCITNCEFLMFKDWEIKCDLYEKLLHFEIVKRNGFQTDPSKIFTYRCDQCEFDENAYKIVEDMNNEND